MSTVKPKAKPRAAKPKAPAPDATPDAPTVKPKAPAVKPKANARVSPAKPKTTTKSQVDLTDEAKSIRIKSIGEASRDESMWVGSHDVADHTIYIIDRDGLQPRFIKSTINISAACMKCPDEIIVNAADQFNRSCNYTEEQGGPVRKVAIDYDEKTGTISVTNDGQGFPICPAEQLKDYDPATMKGKYSVELLITREHAGTNSGPDGQFNGGIHGIGLKAVIAHTSRTVIETVNARSKMYYRQEFLDGMRVVVPPKVIDLTDAAATEELTFEQMQPHTSFIMDLDYSNLCKGTTTWFDAENSQIYARYLETRCYQLAAYFSSLEYRYRNDGVRIDYGHTPQVLFNGKLIRVRNLRDFAMMFPLSGGHFIRWTSSDMTYAVPWHLYIGLRREESSNSVCETVSFINSVYLSEGGSHTNMLLNKLKKGLAPYVTKALAPARPKKDAPPPKEISVEQMKSLERLIFLVDSRQAPHKGFESQSKGKLTVGRDTLNEMIRTYDFSTTDLDAIWNLVGPRYLEMLNGKSEGEKIVEEISTPTRANPHRIPDFECSELFGPKHAEHLMIFACEGKSASIPVKYMLNSRHCPITRKHSSIFTGRGVPIGSLKRAEEIEPAHPVLGVRYRPSAKVVSNRVYTHLMMATNLNYGYHYFYEPELEADRDPGLAKTNPERFALIQELRRQGDIQWATLNVNMLVLAADQDVDGQGQICPQYANWVQTFWPQLLRRPVGPGGRFRFLNRLETPIIRAFPKRAALGAVLEFHSEEMFDTWAKKHYPLEVTANQPNVEIDAEAIEHDYKMKYYKGLGGHGQDELNHMAKSLLSHIIAIAHSDQDREAARIMYGKGTADRKRVLSDHTIISYNPSLLGKKMVLFSEMLMRETKLFQIDTCNRKLPSPIDGMVDSQRKVLAGARLALSRGQEVLVYELTADVVKKEKYKHGNDPLNAAITMMAQNFVGSNNIPHLLAISYAFGSRTLGRDVTGSPRYIYLTYNKVMDLMFPAIDDLLLEYNKEEGTIVEPKYYVPVLPMSILTTYTTTAAGWKISSWARDFYTVVNNVRRMITFDYPSRGGAPMSMLGKPWLWEEMRCVVGKLLTGKVMGEVCLGKYTLDREREELHITQLPLKVWSGIWRRDILGLKKDQLKKEVAAITEAKGKSGKAKAKAKAKPKSKKKKDDFDLDEEAKGDSAKHDKEDKVRFGAKGLVESVFDKTSDDTDGTELFVKLKRGALAQIEEMADPDSFMDPIEQYLELRMQMTTDLNMQDENGFVHSFNNYEEILGYWFTRRKALYIERINRSRVLMKLRVQYYENVLRYIEADGQANKEFNIDGKEDAERESILTKHEFTKFYTTPLFEPTKATGEVLRELVLGTKASYDYIGNLKKSDYWASGIASLRKKLADSKATLKEAEQLTWQTVWNQEIDKVVAAVENGVKRRWSPRDKKVTYAVAP